jgi:hypothetical protein
MEKLEPDRETLREKKDQYERTVEVELPITFNAKGNEILIKLLFSNENKTGGGAIESLTLLEDQNKAVIIYLEAFVAQRVKQRKEIPYSDFVFKINQTSLLKNSNQFDKEKMNGKYV